LGEKKSFWKSKTQQGVAIAAIAMLAQNMGHDVSVTDLGAVSVSVTDLLGAGGLLYAAIGRVMAKVGLKL
jgi:hypothetical protein